MSTPFTPRGPGSTRRGWVRLLALLGYALGLVLLAFFVTPLHQVVPEAFNPVAAVTLSPDAVGTASRSPVGPPNVQRSLVATPVGLASQNRGDVTTPTSTPVSLAGSIAATVSPTSELVTPSITVGSPLAQPTSVGDASWFLYAASGDLWITDGNQSKQLTHDGQLSQPAFDNGILIYVKRAKNFSDLWLLRAHTPPRQLTHDGSADVAADNWVAQPALLPGGRSVDLLADFNKDTTGPGDLAVWQLNLSSGTVQQISRPPPYTGGDQDVAIDPRETGTIVFTRYVYADNGQLTEGLIWLSHGSDQAIPLSTPDHATRQASFAPDGSALAFVQTDGRADDLYLAPIATTPEPHLVAPQQAASGTIAQPAWSPNGTAIAYLALVNRQFQLFTRPVARGGDGTIALGPARQITHGNSLDATSRPVWLSSAEAADVRSWFAASNP